MIRRIAAVAFPATYRDLLSPGQLDYMMEWMYSEESLRGQFRAGHVWFVVSADGEPCGYVSVERQGGSSTCIKFMFCPVFRVSGRGRCFSGAPWRMSVRCVRNPAGWS